MSVGPEEQRPSVPFRLQENLVEFFLFSSSFSSGKTELQGDQHF